MTIAGTGSKTLSRTIDNSGTTSWTDGQILTSGGTFNNLAGGVFSVTAANSFFNSGGTNLFSNTGAFAKNSPSVTVFGIPFTNQAAGVVNVNDGTLALLGGGTNFGTINIAAGATARFGGTFTHAAGSTLMGAGNVDFNTPGITLNGNLIIDGELTFNSASATVAAGATVTKLSLTGSTANVAAGGVLTVGAGGVNFTGTTNNTVTLQPSATTPGMLVLKGNVNYTATDGTAVLNTANFVAGQTPGLMDLFGATRTFSISDGAQAIDLSVSGRVTNGAIVKSGAGTMRLDSPNLYTGGTTISAGTLEVLDPAGLSSGGVTIGDATLSLKSDLASPVTFGNNLSVTGDAAVNVDRISVGSSGVYRLGTVSIGATRLSVSGANRSLEIAGLNLSGAATLNTAVPLTITGAITESAAGLGITKSTGTAKLTIGGSAANTYTGLTRVNAGAVELNKPAGVTAVGGDLQVFGGSVKLLADQQIASIAAVSAANASSLIDFAGHSQTMAALAVTGNASATVGATGTASQLGTAMLRVTSLTVNTGGKLDLANNRLIDDYSGGTPITSIRAAIAAGYANGSWNGPGIQSSTAIANPTRGLGYAEASDVLAFANGATSDTFLASSVDKTTLLVRYTLAGDANLDGTVDFLDLSRLAQNYNVTDGTRTWAQGDYNYDGNVDFSDLAKLAQSYNTTLPGGAAAIPAGAPAGFEADLARAFAAAVPEPSSLIALSGLAVMLMGRRRRRRAS
jgi:autotransporter-associated beta strand protein